MSCAAALAGIEVLQEGNLVNLAEEKGKRCEVLLVGNLEIGKLGNKEIREIRRKGLTMGLDLTDPANKGPFNKALLEHGIITDWSLFSPATFRIAPPLTITEVEIEEACNRVNKALKRFRK